MNNAKSWRQIQKGKEINKKSFKALGAKLNAMLDDDQTIEDKKAEAYFKGVAYTADLCKHENFTALCPWCKPRINWNKLLFTDKEIKNPIKTSQGIILILNHLLSLALFTVIVAYWLSK